MLQKLINSSDDGELSPKKKPRPLNDRHQHLEAIEQDFQKHLLEACNGIIYDEEIIELLLNLLQNDPPFRMITFKLISSIVCHLAFNKKMECSLKAPHAEKLVEAYHLSI